MPQAGESVARDEAATEPPVNPSMLIGEVAAATGLTQRTLRYYEEIGLLPPATRLEGGFRLYSEEDVSRLRRIIELKRTLGFSLVEVKEMLEMEDERREHRSTFHREADPLARREAVVRSLDLARRQLAVLDSRLGGLLDLKTKTEQRIARYDSELAALDASSVLVEVGRNAERDAGR